MPRLSFVTPVALALLLLLPLLWALALLAPRRVALWRLWASLLVRSLLLIALTLALAGAQLIRPVRDLTTVFLIDASDSVAPAQRERALRYVEEALRSMPPADRAAVVVFGENALVEQAPASLAALGRLRSAPITTRTNIQDAVQLGLALLPAETQKRLVLLSDGGENAGRAADAARLAAVRGVPLDIVSLLGERGPDVIVSALDAPGNAREGQEIALGVTVRSSYATTGRLQLFVDGRSAGERDVQLEAGTNDISLRIPAGEAGFRRIEVRLEAQGDSEPQNNRAAAFTEVQGPPRILLIATDASRAANLRSALEAAGVRIDLLAPSEAPATLAQLSAYAAVVLVDTPARELPRALVQALPAYVRELGRGLAMIGGAESFGAGGYRRTPIEAVLPVALDPTDLGAQPDLALVMVIDRSGSMQDSAGQGGRTKLDLAKEAVYQASLGLSQRDQVGLVVFDEDAEWVLPLTTLPPAVEIEQALSSFDASGGTNIRPGVEQAAEALDAADAKIKHVILLTDGIADSNYGDLIDRMRAAGITISTVAIGEDANPNLEQIAERGGGRFYRVERVEEVPRIFLQETVIVAGRDIVEEPITPVVALPAPVVRGLEGLPPLYGYNGTEIRAAARTILTTPDGKPLLAQWQYGLGRSVAWTSDLKGQWARDWVRWGQFTRFVGGLADMLLPPRDTGNLALRASSEGAQATLELTAQDDQGKPLNGLAVQGQLIDPTNRAAPLRFLQIGPGRYRALAATTTPGVYLAQVVAQDASGASPGTATTGVVVSYSLEYGDRRDNPQLLSELTALTGGRMEPPPAAVFEPLAQAVGSVREIGMPLLWLALLLLPIDIGLRRLFLRSSDVALALEPLRRRLLRRAAPASGSAESVARLSAAKQRARTSSRPALTPPAGNAASLDDAVPEPLSAARRAVPDLRSAPFEGSQPPQAVRQPPPSSQQPGEEATQDEPPAAPPEADETAEDQFARLMAAKRRARRQRGGP